MRNLFKLSLLVVASGLLAACGSSPPAEVVVEVLPTVADLAPAEITTDPTAVEVVAPTLAPTETSAPAETATPVPTDTPVATVAPTSPAWRYANSGPAPQDFLSEPWINTDQPIHLADLEGKVVLVEFWTFG